MKESSGTEQSSLELRPPIVSVCGHVDHGKTTLLDTIRETNVASKEAGGITQSIGASTIKTKDSRQITFIDTPGHAAFSNMRSRGAKVADIVVLVIAADDGVKPQTKEALEHINKAKVPFVVAITKMDLQTANVESTKGQLEKEGVSFEGRGGDTPVVEVSGKTKEGINELLETIILVAEVNEIKASENSPLEAVVIETGKDKRGSLVSVVVRNGKIQVKDEVVSDDIVARVKGLFDDAGKNIKEVKPGFPGLILGFSDLPQVGSILVEKNTETLLVVKERKNKVAEVKEGEIPVIIKAKSQGSLEAVLANLPDEAVAVSFGVGDVTESDVFMAKASGPAYILTFEASVPTGVKKLAETEGVKIFSFKIIYELFQKLEEIIIKGKDVVNGKAKIVQIFPFDGKKVAGCKVVSGEIKRPDTIILKRGETDLGEVKITSMKKQKDEITIAKVGEECGILFRPQLDFVLGDMLVSVTKHK